MNNPIPFIVFGACVLIGSPFAFVFLRAYSNIRKKYNVDIWTNFKNMNRVLLGKPIDGLDDNESRELLKNARIGLIGWNIVVLPGAIVFMYYVYMFVSNNKMPH
jgi:hypothetical protein